VLVSLIKRKRSRQIRQDLARSNALQKESLPTLEPVQEIRQQNNDKYKTESTRGVVTPPARIRPGRNCAYKKH
jgi:hypothetical protein